jgi:phosphoglycerate dehydrogenase-like enzyme
VLVWLPTVELKHQLGLLDGLTLEVVEDWSADALPASKSDVEVIVPPEFYSGDFRAITQQLPRLRIVQTLSAGVDRYTDALPPDVRLYNASGVHAAATAEWVLAAVLACERDLLTFAADRRARAWSPRPSRGLSGASVVIIGAGEIGLAVGERLKLFGAHIAYVARRAREGVVGIANVGHLLPGADIVILLIPHTQQTDRLVGAEFLASMKTGALIVNAGRGAVVDSSALVDELASGRLRAALDVFDPEPPAASSEIWSVPGLLLTPHIASNVLGVVNRQAALLVTRLTAFARGEEVPGVRDQGY